MGCTARHSFCAPCIEIWFEIQGGAAQRSCPIDRRELPLDEKPVVDSELEEAIKGSLVKCPNDRLGCEATFELREWAEHLEGCAFRTLQCPHCLKPTSAADLERHAKHCYRRCLDCGVAVPSDQLAVHKTSLCLAMAHGLTTRHGISA